MRTMHLAAITFAAWAGTAEPAAVTIYKYVDAQGRVTYTNQIPRGEARYTTLEVETDAPAAAPAEAPPPPTRRPAKGKARAAKADAYRSRASPVRYAAWSAALSVASLDAGRRGGRVLPVVRLGPGEDAPESLDLRLDSRLGGVAITP